ncbi:MAG: bacillithiol biosynthesis BshC, partial [Myxococcota bacterium]
SNDGEVAVVGSALTRALNHVGLGPEEATPENLDRVALEQMKVDPEWLHSRLRDALESELAAVEHKLLEIDKGLARPLEQTRKTVGFALEKLSTRVGSAQMRSDTTLQARIERIRDELYPFGAPQERILGCPSFFARYGVEGFKSALRSASDVPAGERAVVAPVPIPTGGAL